MPQQPAPQNFNYRKPEPYKNRFHDDLIEAQKFENEMSSSGY